MSKPFEISSSFEPAGDQPAAFVQLTEGIQAGLASQILLGVTGSGKTFTMAHVIEKLQRPPLLWPTTKPWRHSSMASLRSSFPITRWSTSCPITITSSLKPMCRLQIRLLRKMPQSTTTLSKCGCRLLRPC